jgi:hypothetical protein
MLEQHVQTLFEGEALKIEAFHCDRFPVVPSHEEASSRHEIVFPGVGAFVRHDASGQAVADANHVLFFHAAQPYQISHP